MQRLLTITLLVVAIAACSRYPLDKGSDRFANEAIVRGLYKALDSYRADRGVYPESLALLTPEYVAELPTTVAGHEFQYQRSDYLKRSDEFTIFWYQSTPGEVNACSVRRKVSQNGEVSEADDCWNPDRRVHRY